jgi:Glycosyltransferases, probably involved in cell wall biogenesis
MPRISIFIPTRNEAKYIGNTLAQFEPFWDKYDCEIIVSDAHSSDGTVEIVQHFAELSNNRVKLVQAGPGKQNIAIGCNQGAAHTQAPLLFRIDADVRIPDKERFFDQVLAAFDRDPVLVGATVPIWVYPEEAIASDKLFHIFMNAIIRASFWVKAPLAKGECQLVRRSAFEQIGGYDERLTAGEDCNLFLSASGCGAHPVFEPLARPPFAAPFQALRLLGYHVHLPAGGALDAHRQEIVFGRVETG